MRKSIKLNNIARRSCMFITAAIVVFFSLVPQAAALSKCQQEVFLKDIGWFNCEPDTDPCVINANNATKPVDGSGQVVFLDPGHGAAVPQYVDAKTGLSDRETHNVPETEDMFEVAGLVKAGLEAAGYKVVLSKDSAEAAVNKRQRVDKAVSAGASVAVSIHSDGGREFNKFGEVWYQQAGLYREYNGKRVTFSNVETANKSKLYAEAIRAERDKAEVASSGRTKATADQSGSFGASRVGVESKGNISLLQLWSDSIPWIYNEVGAKGGLSQLQKQAYATGIINGVKASFGASTPAADASIDTTATAGAASGQIQALETLEGHTVPARRGGTGQEEEATKAGSRIVLKRTGSALSFAPSNVSDKDIQYYVAMRWRIVGWKWDGHTANIPNAENGKWFNQATRKLLVTNSRTGRSIVVAAIESGPAPWGGSATDKSTPPPYWQGVVDGTPAGYDGRVAGLSPAAMQALNVKQWQFGGKTGDTLEYGWSSNQSLDSGTILEKGQVVGAATSSTNNCSSSASTANPEGVNKIIEIAKSQVGIKEGSAEGKADPDKNCNKYFEGKGSCQSTAWCAAFTRWVFRQAGYTDVGGGNMAKQVGKWFNDHKVFFKWQESYKPMPGDVFVKSRNGSGSGWGGQGHIGIVIAVEGFSITTVEGNSGNAVRENHYRDYRAISDLIGFGRYADKGSLTTDSSFNPGAAAPGAVDSGVSEE